MEEKKRKAAAIRAENEALEALLTGKKVSSPPEPQVEAAAVVNAPPVVDGNASEAAGENGVSEAPEEGKVKEKPATVTQEVKDKAKAAEVCSPVSPVVHLTP